MTYSYLDEILILFAAAVVVVVISLRLRLPPILGYLCMGVLLGPYGLALIDDTEHTRRMAEFGVVFLLFTIGLEFSITDMIKMRRIMIGIGGLQVLISTLVTTVAAMIIGLDFTAALLLGGVVAMSSTALVSRQLTDQLELHAPHGRNAIGILLFQDLMVIPFLILAASYSDSTGLASDYPVLLALFGGILAVVLIFTLGRWVLRPLFQSISYFRSNELFTLTALLVALAAAWFTHKLGLSMALGAFIAGMMLGETEFRHQIGSAIRPFLNILLALFFITIGMLLNIAILPDVWPWVMIMLLGLFTFKLALVSALCHFSGQGSVVAMRTGLVLAHGGEFGFAILALGIDNGLFSMHYGQIVLASLLISMAIAPLMIRFNGWITTKVLPNASKLNADNNEEHVIHSAMGLSNHIIICGYGCVGQNIARFLEDEEIPFIAMEIDPLVVQNGLQNCEPVTYADATNIKLLIAAGLNRAAALVISIDDSPTAHEILHQLRTLNFEIPVLVRTHNDASLESLQAAGATEVIPETLEASLIISYHLLVMLNKSPDQIQDKIIQSRYGRYDLLRRRFSGKGGHVIGLPISHLEQPRAIELPENASAINQHLSALHLDKKGIIIMAVHREGGRIPNPAPDLELLAHDVLILFGTPTDLNKARDQLLGIKPYQKKPLPDDTESPDNPAQ